MACTMPDQTSKSTREAFASIWIKHYGWPELLVTDQGPEFIGHEFTQYVGENGCIQHYIDSQSQWQQGRTERAGDSLKEDLRDVMEACAIVTEDEFDLALTTAIDARNRYVNRSGFSAHQRVFGSSIRLPGSLMSDDPTDRLALHTDPSTEFARAAEIRDSAQKALFKHADHEAVARAARARSRILQPNKNIRAGDVAYVWRSSPRHKIRGWVGPGVVVCVNAQGTSAWISMRGVLVKTNMDRIRIATDSEWLGAELIKILSADAKAHLERAGQRGYVDASDEEGPVTESESQPTSDAASYIIPQGLDSIPEDQEMVQAPPPVDVPVGSDTVTSDSTSSSSSDSSPSTPNSRRPAPATPAGGALRGCRGAGGKRWAADPYMRCIRVRRSAARRQPRAAGS